MKLVVQAIALGTVLTLAACNKTNRSEGSEPVKPSVESSKPATAGLHAAFPDLSVDKVASLIKEKGCIPIDANKEDTRKEYGTLPGAVLLSDYSNFKPDELPSDKSSKLVFYCGSSKCTAAPKAATLAKKAGYSDVNVMRAGILGWVKAGKKVDRPTT